MLGAPHLAHAAGAEPRDEPVAAELAGARFGRLRASARDAATWRRMRTRFHARTSARPTAIASAPALAMMLERSSARVGPSSVRAGTIVATYQSSGTATPARLPPIGATEARYSPSLASRSRKRGARRCRAANSASSAGSCRSSWRSSLSLAGSASLIGRRVREDGAVARVHDRARLIERGPRDERRQRADVEVDGEHRVQRRASRRRRGSVHVMPVSWLLKNVYGSVHARAPLRAASW